MPKSTPIVAPLNAEPQSILYAEIKRANLSVDAVRDLCWLINAYCHLASFPRICENLLTILNLIAAKWSRPLSTWGLELWPISLSWIIENRQELANKIKNPPKFDRGPRPDGGNPLLWECAERNPLYTSLWNRHEDPTRQQRYWLLQGQVLISHVVAMREYSTRDGYEQYAGDEEWSVLPNRAYPMSRALRYFSRQSSGTFFDTFPVELPPEAFAFELSALSPPDNSDVIMHHKALSHFLLYVARNKWRPRNVFRTADEADELEGESNWRTAQHYEWELGDISDPEDLDDPDDDWGLVTQVSNFPPPTNERQKEWLQAGDCPDDIEDGSLALYSSYHESTHVGDQNPSRSTSRDLGNRLEVAKARVKHITMANQLLPWASGLLSVDELADVIRYCTLWMNEHLKQGVLSEENLSRFEDIALLHIILFSGSSHKRALQLRVLHPNARNSDAELVLRLASASGQAHSWRIPAVRPPYKTQQVGQPGKQRELIDFLSLPDIAGSSYFVLRLLGERERINSRCTNEARSSTIVFPNGLAHQRDYRTRLNSLLAEIDPTGRITLSKMANWLFLRTVAITGGDVAAASLISGKRHYLAKVRSYYACVPARRLQQLYVRIVSEAAAHFRDILNAESLAVECFRPVNYSLLEPNVFVGCRFCPICNAVVEAIGGLQNTLTEAAKYRDLTGWIRYHNLYTLYSVWTFSYATAARGISSPYLELSQVDLTNGLARLGDKDPVHKTRLLSLLPAVVEQMKHYADHLAVVRREVDKSTLDIAIEEPCFFLDANKGAIQVCPKTLLEHMEQFLAFPANVHRSFMRSELIERNCPSEIVDAWMGHWYRGEDPWGEFSSFPPNKYCEALTKYLSPSLSELGFHPIRSCFV